MSNQIFKMILTVVMALCSVCVYGQCEAKIKDFYVAYMQNAENNEEANVELLKAHMSPELISKLADYTQQFDADAVIHAQDVCKYGIESLTVLPMGQKDWYAVKYKWSPDSDYTIIPVKATCRDDKFMILDISPESSTKPGA